VCVCVYSGIPTIILLLYTLLQHYPYYAIFQQHESIKYPTRMRGFGGRGLTSNYWPNDLKQTRPVLSTTHTNALSCVSEKSWVK
jgi:hypothetical protein